MMQTSKAIKNPGLRTLPPGVERYLVQGGGINVLEIFPELLMMKENKFAKLFLLIQKEKEIYQFLI